LVDPQSELSFPALHMHRAHLAKKRQFARHSESPFSRSELKSVQLGTSPNNLDSFADLGSVADGPDLGTLNPDLLGAVMSIFRFAREAVRLPSLFSIAFGLAVALVASSSAVSVQAEDTHEVEISIKNHKFEPDALKLPVGKPIKISIKNLDASPEEFESHDLGFEKVIAGNSGATIRLKPLKPGTYMFFGEYHQDTALGHIVAE
jgi:plastocyanin